GPEQNFTYIAATQPKIAFIFDIRRQNMLKHLMYKTMFEMSTNRMEFLSRLFSRPAPTGLTDKTPIASLFRAFDGSAPDTTRYRQNLRAIQDRLRLQHGIEFSAADRSDMETIYQQFFTTGPGTDYSGSFGSFNGNSNYATLMTSTDERGQAWRYLASEESFEFVREMEKR